MSDSGPAARESIYRAVLELAHTCESELGHTQHVTFLALKLFDGTQILHKLGQRERDWLEYAGLLHDIGWIEGEKGHHKNSLRIILSTSMLPFDSKERLVIGSIARYHRKADPSEKHDHFKALEPDERRVVVMLAALLRLADGLDCLHKSQVKDITCQVGAKTIELTCLSEKKHLDELEGALDKGKFIEKVFNRRLQIKIKKIPDRSL